MEAHHQPMHEGESRTALKKSGHMGTDVEAVMPPLPGLKGRSGNLELFGRLTLGDALGSQLSVLLKEGLHVRVDPSVVGCQGCVAACLGLGFP